MNLRSCWLKLGLLLIASLAIPLYAEVTIEVVTSAKSGESHVAVKGISDAERTRLQALQSDQLNDRLKLFVSGKDEKSSRLPAVFGDCRWQGEHLLFQPRFPLLPGQDYLAEFQPAGNSPAVSKAFRLPRELPKPTAKVVGVYPSSRSLPQNLLKFYLYFSEPMQQGRVYQYLQITDDQGKQLPGPFLELAEELWDRSGTRLTLLLDPARVKQGLVPREEDGSIFEVSKTYRLKISKNWPDANGQPLTVDETKEFLIVEPDFEQPKPEEWKIQVVSSANQAINTSVKSMASQGQVIQIDFNEPLDRAMLEHSLVFVDPSNRTLTGDVVIAEEESCVQFLPASKLTKGRYQVRINPLLEDRCGNSIQRAFEVDSSMPKDLPPPTTELYFEVD
jgi:hypothetical protein